ncbi:hypothetical protein R1sor_002610 [Riccia sorocarpa]|uniref:DUF4218 domain-containing protein n=1 Tax=Riccia sorocarpa TaxID=122646 RepID=A0ABD3GZA1_9MARC
MDVYLEPLVEELKLLWDGVRAYDASTRCPREDRWFQLHAICRGNTTSRIWTKPSLNITGASVLGWVAYPTFGRCDARRRKCGEDFASTYMGQSGHHQPSHPRMRREFGMHPHAWPYTRSNGMEAIPPAEWVLSAHHKRLFIQRIQQLKCPTGYASNFRMAFTTHEDTCIANLGNLGERLKTHDFHKLIQDIIPIVMVDLGNDNLRKAIWALSKLLRWVCNKEIRLDEVDAMHVHAAETLCLLQRCLPPSFFKGQTHWLIHLVREFKETYHILAGWSRF